MKITIEHESLVSTIEDKEIVGIEDTMNLIKQSLLAIGFHPETVKNGFEYILEDYGEKNE